LSEEESMSIDNVSNINVTLTLNLMISISSGVVYLSWPTSLPSLKTVDLK